jgi:sphingolipid delta-4 desaturase
MKNKNYSKTEEFIFSSHPEAHRLRRKEILKKYPHIKQLFGREPKTKYLAFVLVLIQLCLASYAQTLNWVGWGVLLYVFGAILSHSIYTAIHELTHHLGFDSKILSRLFSILINLPLGIPMAVSFEKYHFIHHRFMGDPIRDVDIPFPLEAKLFSSRLGKLIWLVLQPFTYSLRPLVKYPQKINSWEWLNIVVQLVFNASIVYFLGWGCLLFLLLSSLLAMSFHPVAAHAIAEHYVVHAQQETYSYYGPWNYILFNVGHHVEHHDFPNIPWSRIARLKKIAPEYYDVLYAHKSWTGLMIRFVLSAKINLFSRVIR